MTDKLAELFSETNVGQGPGARAHDEAAWRA